MTPISLASPPLAYEFADCLKIVSAYSAFAASEVGRTPVNVKGFLSLKATPRKTQMNPRVNDKTQSSALSLLESKLIKSCSVADRLGHRQRGQNGHLKEGRNGIRKAPSKIERLNGLVIQESSIKVKCRIYVYSSFASTTVLVIGGLVSAFLVGERIPGVDPFNLAMYSWIIGGLVLLIAKIVHVSEWTLREFFLGEVACRSLSEVASLTGLDAQEILVHLLPTEG
ncbi:hypothetical protein CSOJ01_13942 [Colletotrichum sojae]|uniref:Uncharacterized protein n=1 Tax=Colletotrichum sojae TaxID=2175907 RepID=A0A8H6IRI4_9PEZI|nr:hypothetical protein CSOJ01_13942 [Colletotrichum sojae]